MSFFDRIDALRASQPQKPPEQPKQTPMPKLSFAEIDAMQQEQQQQQQKIARKKPGPKPKVRP